MPQFVGTRAIAVGSRELSHAFAAPPPYPCAMIFLAAFSRLSAAPEPPANDLLAKTRAVRGHFGFIVITLVYVLITFCKG
jgi:hypothetical protein